MRTTTRMPRSSSCATTRATREGAAGEADDLKIKAIKRDGPFEMHMPLSAYDTVPLTGKLGSRNVPLSPHLESTGTVFFT